MDTLKVDFASIAEAVAYYARRGYNSVEDRAPFIRWMKSPEGVIIRIERMDFLTVKVSPEND